MIVKSLFSITEPSSSHIIGTGTYLDTARMKAQVSKALKIDGRAIEGYVLGEHGNSQFYRLVNGQSWGQSFFRDC